MALLAALLAACAGNAAAYQDTAKKPDAAPSTPAPKNPPAPPKTGPTATAADLTPAPPKPVIQTPLKAFTVASLVRTALIDLRAQEDPSPEDYRIAGAIIDMARALDPDDLELLRRRLEAAFNAEDPELVESLNRQILLKDPADTVAQLALITTHIGRLQSAKERLDAFDRFLGKDGEKLDPAVRSRLALDAALILRETGDNDAFESRLKLALKLDQTNKDAASLAVTYFSESAKDDQTRFELLTNLLLADPFDPGTHRAIRDLLASVGAFKQAQRYAEYADRLSPTVQGEAKRQRTLDVLILQWLNDGPKKIIDMLNEELLQERARAEADIKKQMEAKEGLGTELQNLPKPEDVRLYLPVDKIRALCADAIGDRDTLVAAMTDVGRSVDYKSGNLLDTAKRDQLLTDEEAIAQAAGMRLDLALLRLLLGIDADKVIEDRKAFDPASGYDPDRIAAVDAWLKVRAGDTAGAARDFDALPEDDVMRELGLATLAEIAGDKAAAAEHYRVVGSRNAGKPLGAWSLAKLRALLGSQTASLSPEMDAIIKANEALPAWIGRMLDDPRSFMRVSAKLNSTTLPAPGQVRISLQIKNLSPVPLGAGPEAPVSTRVLISPQFERGSKAFTGLPPEIALVDRRLRLLPGETVEMNIDPDAGMSGWLIQSGCADFIRGRWRILQGFVAAGEIVEPSVNSLSAETGVIIHPALAEASLSGAALAKLVQTCASDELPALLLAARVQLIAGSEDAEALRAALIERYKSGTRVERMAMLTALPPQSIAPAVAPFDDAVKGEKDPQLAMLALLTRTIDFQDPLFAAAQTSTDAALADLARSISSRPSRAGVLLGASWPKFNPAGVRQPASGAKK